MRIEFDHQCSTERRHDPLTIVDSSGRTVSVRSGRDWSDWSQELRVSGQEIRWKFSSDGSVNGWGWKFTVYPIMPSAAPLDMLSDRKVLSRPSIDLVMCLLGFELESATDRHILPRLAVALAACAQLSSLGAPQRMWALKKLRQLILSAPSEDNFNVISSVMASSSGSEQHDMAESQKNILSVRIACVRSLCVCNKHTMLFCTLCFFLPSRSFIMNDVIGRCFSHCPVLRLHHW